MRSIVLVAALLCGCDAVFRLDHIELPSDGPPRPELMCDTPVPALAAPPAAELAEPGFDETGLVLLVRQGSSMREIARASLTSPFEPPRATTVLDASITDPSFTTIDSQVVAFGSLPPAPRKIVICREPSAASTCDVITITDDTGSPISDDHDGPSVAIRDGAPVMVFSRGAALYIASPAAVDLLSWTAKRLDLGGLTVDDGALTSDGELLIVPVAGGLVSLAWDDTAATFVDPKVLSIPGTSPTLFEQGDQIELAVTLSDRNILEPYLARCTRR